MFNFDEVRLGKIVVHSIGNRHNEEGIRFSRHLLELDEMMRDLLKKYFLSSFKTPQYFRFASTEELGPNMVNEQVDMIFGEEQLFFNASKIITEFLYENSNHPKIKAGEFYMVMLKDCLVDGEVTDAIGIFKSENKETYIKVFPKGEVFEVEQEKGININRLDKGCLVFNTNKEDGYKVLIVDNLGKGQNAQYWSNDFLKLVPLEDNFFQTQNYLKLTKGFVDEVYNSANEVERADQIDMLNRSVDYFKNKDHFDQEEFNQEVMLGDDSIQDAFKEYKQHYEDVNQAQMEKAFPISDDAVRKEKGKLRSILKLDRNFHVYIHGSRNYVDKGWDEERGMKFYKLYFHEES